MGITMSAPGVSQLQSQGGSGLSQQEQGGVSQTTLPDDRDDEVIELVDASVQADDCSEYSYTCESCISEPYTIVIPSAGRAAAETSNNEASKTRIRSESPVDESADSPRAWKRRKIIGESGALERLSPGKGLYHSVSTGSGPSTSQRSDHDGWDAHDSPNIRKFKPKSIEDLMDETGDAEDTSVHARKEEDVGQASDDDDLWLQTDDIDFSAVEMPTTESAHASSALQVQASIVKDTPYRADTSSLLTPPTSPAGLRLRRSTQNNVHPGASYSTHLSAPSLVTSATEPAMSSELPSTAPSHRLATEAYASGNLPQRIQELQSKVDESEARRARLLEYISTLECERKSLLVESSALTQRLKHSEYS